MPVKSSETALPVFRMELAPSPNSLYFICSAPQFPIPRFCQPSLMAQVLARLAATWMCAKSLAFVVARISGEPFFTAKAFATMVFSLHTKHHRRPLCRKD